MTFDKYSPLISICIPTYNRSGFLTRSINSALNQSYENYEILIIDDGSTDNTRQIIESFNNSKIRYIYKEHTGIPDTRNRALAEAKGEFILWLDSDDEIFPNILELYIAKLNEQRNLELIYPNLQIIDEEGKQKQILKYQNWNNRQNEALQFALKIGSPFPNASSLVKKSIYEEIGNFDLEFKRAQDFDFWVRMLIKRNTIMYHYDTILYSYYMHKDNVTGLLTDKTNYKYERIIISNILTYCQLYDLFSALKLNNSDEIKAKVFKEIADIYMKYNSLVNAIQFLELSDKLNFNYSVKQLISELRDSYESSKSTLNRFMNEYPIELLQNNKDFELLFDIINENPVNIDKISINSSSTTNVNRKVLLFCDYFLPSIGGVEVFISELGKQLQKKGFSIDVMCRWLPNRKSNEIDGMKIIDWKIGDEATKALNTSVIREAANYIDTNHYDAIIALSQPDNWVGQTIYLAKKHNNLIFLPSIRKELIKHWEAVNITDKVVEVLKKAKHLISVSENGWDNIFFEQHKLSHIFVPHSINPKKSDIDFKEKYNLKHKHFLLVVANFYPIKNQLNLLKQFANINEDWNLVIIGHQIKGFEFYFEQCQKIADLNDNILIIPGLSTDDTNAAISQADLLLVPSLGESAGPLSLLQAMHYGTPWIATPDCNSALDEAGGVLADVVEFPRLAKILLENPEFTNRLSQLGIKHHNISFKWDKSIDLFVDLINNKEITKSLYMPLNIRNEMNILNAEFVELQKKEVQKEFPDKQYEYDFSVIIPTYNRPDVLKMCLDSLQNQTYDKKKYEVIVIDDGSTDDTEILCSKMKYDYTFRYIKQENSGPGAARNKGINIAKGKYTLIINDDAILDKYNLQVHWNTHQEMTHKRVAVLGTFNYAVEFVKRPFVWIAENTPLIFGYSVAEPNRFHNYRFFWTCNISIRTEVLLKVGGFDPLFNEPMMEDTELGFRLEQIGFSVLFSPKAKATHYHWIDISGFEKRQIMAARNVLKFISKYPKMLVVEGDIFDLTLDNFKNPDIYRNRIAEYEPYLKKIIPTFNKLDERNIIKSDKDKLFLDDGSEFNKQEFLANMYSVGMMIHQYNYYSEILNLLPKLDIDAIEKQIYSKTTYTNVEQEHSTKNTLDEGKTKILMTVFGWNNDGGGSALPKSIAQHLAKRGYEIIIFTEDLLEESQDFSFRTEFRTEEGIKIYSVKYRKSYQLFVAQPELEIFNEPVVQYYQQVLEQTKPDLIHYHNFLGLSFGIVDVAKDLHIPSIFTAHNYYLIDPGLYMFDYEKKFTKWQNTDFFTNSFLVEKHPKLIPTYNRRKFAAIELLKEKVDCFIAISKKVANIFDEFAGIKDKTIILNQVSEACDTILHRDKQYTQNGLQVAFMGSIYPHKGIEMIYRAAEILSNYDIIFNIYANGNIEILDFLQKGFPNAKVYYKGEYTYNDFDKIANENDLVLIPSLWEEGGPLVAPEALYMGLPVVGANLGGLPDFIIDGINGKLYKHNNIFELTDILKNFLQNKDELKKLQRNTSIPFTFEEYINKLIEIYNSFLENKITDLNHKNLIFRDLLTYNKDNMENKQNNLLDISSILENLDSESKSYNNTQISENQNADLLALKYPKLLHLGSQGRILEGFDNLDIMPSNEKEIQSDIKNLNYADCSVDLIYAENILQVFPHRLTRYILAEWVRVLKIGGVIILYIPNLKSIISNYLQNRLTNSEINKLLFGLQSTEYDYLYNAFDLESIANHLKAVGLEIVELKSEKINSDKYETIYVRAIKLNN